MGRTGDTCIVTGGAGFIGCAISHMIGSNFDRYIVIDSLHPQVHSQPTRPERLAPSAEFVHGDVTDGAVWDAILADTAPDVIIHLAAETGTGQSLNQATRHGHVNVVGTTVMLDALGRARKLPRQMLLASSRATYGEGAWRSSDEKIFYPGQRSREQLEAHQWDFADARPLPGMAARTLTNPTSIYGATKLAQEHILKAWSTAYGVDLTILRFQNVYGPGQSLINAYTGIVSLFARLAREKRVIPLYEDGQMLRDFVYIDDVAAAIAAAVTTIDAGRRILDVGSGVASTIRDVALFMSARYAAPDPVVSSQFRLGDVRHASCNIAPTLEAMDWSPKWELGRGLDALCNWIDGELR